MLRLSLALWIAIAPAYAWAGSISLLGAGTAPVASGGGCSQATTFLARTSGLNGTETTAYTTLICGLVTDGIITGSLSGATGCGTVLDALYIFATKDTTTANLNLCGTSFGLTTHGSPTFTADHGYTGDAAAAYLDTGFAPLTAGGIYAQNSASFGAYVLSSRTTSIDYAEMGTQTSGGGVPANMFLRDSTGMLFPQVNVAESSVAGPANAQGNYVFTRTGANAVVVYRNGTSFTTTATSSAGKPAFNFIILGRINGGGTPADFTGDQLGSAFIGGGLDATKSANIASRLNAYMTALGINVY